VYALDNVLLIDGGSEYVHLLKCVVLIIGCMPILFEGSIKKLAVSATNILIVFVLVLYWYLLIMCMYWYCIGTCNEVELSNTIIS
jgi:hypothetical protein